MIENIIFCQTDDETTQEAFRLLDESEEAAIEFLKQWHYPGEHETTEKPGAGTRDYTYEDAEGYILTWNRGLGYIGLEYRMEENE